jgi:hypothetical protein
VESERERLADCLRHVRDDEVFGQQRDVENEWGNRNLKPAVKP